MKPAPRVVARVKDAARHYADATSTSAERVSVTRANTGYYDYKDYDLEFSVYEPIAGRYLDWVAYLLVERVDRDRQELEALLRDGALVHLESIMIYARACNLTEPLSKTQEAVANAYVRLGKMYLDEIAKWIREGDNQDDPLTLEEESFLERVTSAERTMVEMENFYLTSDEESVDASEDSSVMYTQKWCEDMSDLLENHPREYNEYFGISNSENGDDDPSDTDEDGPSDADDDLEE